MASVYKQTRKKPIPKNAEIIDRRGKKLVVWISRGRKRQGKLNPDGKSMLVTDRNYTVEWFDWQGTRRKVSGGPDKDAAEALGRQKETEAMQRRQGLIDPRLEKIAAAGRRPFKEHVADFRSALEDKGDTPDHVELTLARLNRVLEACGVERIEDLTASAASAAVADLKSGGLKSRTCNDHLRAVKQFSRWLHRNGRSTHDGLNHLTIYNVDTDRGRERRVLSPDDFRRVVKAAKTGPVVEGVPGLTRAMMYILAAWTGFRRKELSSLTRRSFDLDSERVRLTQRRLATTKRESIWRGSHPAKHGRTRRDAARVPRSLPRCQIWRKSLPCQEMTIASES